MTMGPMWGMCMPSLDAWGRAQVSTVDSVRLTTEMAALPLVLRLLSLPLLCRPSGRCSHL